MDRADSLISGPMMVSRSFGLPALSVFAFSARRAVNSSAMPRST